MFAYLTKKIALANQKKIYCLSWSHQTGCIACGADNGLLKVLRLEDQNVIEDKKESNDGEEQNQPRFLTMNQSLEGHNNSVIHLAWNDKYEKLVSSDVNGLIIVWMFYKGHYYEEMISNRSRSVVIDVKWTFEGDKICIVFEDASISVRSVEGQRLWTKDNLIKVAKITCAMWSPNGKFLLFGLSNGQVHCYDNNGNFFTKVPLFLKASNHTQNNFKNAKFTYTPTQNQISVVSICWFVRKSAFQFNPAKVAKNQNKDLAIAFSNGEVHLLANENDDDAIVVQTSFSSIKQIHWNPNGTILAVCGSTIDQSTQKVENYVRFIDKSDYNLDYSMFVPGNELVCCSWEQSGIKIALAVDSFILFANVRTDYKLAYFSDTLTFILPKQPNNTILDQLNQDSQVLIFYRLNNNKMTTKLIPELLDLSSKDQYCCIGTNLLNEDNLEMKSTLQLCNSIGTTIDTINLDFKIKCLTMNSTRAIAASTDSFCIWKFKTPINPLNAQKKSSSVMIDAATDEEFENYDKLFNVYLSRTETVNACCCSDNQLVIGQSNSVFSIYNLPRASLAFKLNLQNCIPRQVSLNLNSDRLAILSTDGKFNIFQLEINSGKLLDFSRKDVWGFKWSTDSANLLVLNERSKLYMCTFKDQFTMEDKEEKTGISYGYLCEVKNLVAKVVNFDNFYLDLIEKKLDFFHLTSYIELFESDLLKTTKLLFEKGDLMKISKFIEQNSHQTLWTLLADCALRANNYEIAELAMVKCQNFKGLQFLKRLKKLNDSKLQKAEVCLYLGELEEAKRIYQSTGRLDLEINMRKLFGDWESLLELVKSELGADQTFLSTVYDELGQHYLEKQDYLKAVDCFRQSDNHELLKICLIRLEKYDEIEKLAKSNPDLNDLQLAQYLQSIGMCEQAIQIYLNCDKKEKAIDCAISLNEWQKAIQLAQKYSSNMHVDELLQSYAEHLKTKKQDFSIIELYCKAKNYSKAITSLLELANRLKSESFDCLKLKKMYTIIGIIYEEKIEYEKENEKTDENLNRKSTKLSSLLDSNLLEDNSRFIFNDDVWKYAESYHFYILAQRQLLDGYYDAAMKTSLILIDYEQFIDTVQIYSLIALTSVLNRNFSIASKAFIKLELLEDQNDEENEDDNLYKKFACQIFSKYSPKLPANVNKIECPFCESKNYDFNTVCSNCETKFKFCIASGRQILENQNELHTCKRCKHVAIKSDLINYNNCPLCHLPL